jgi:predicted dinucleotide-utilizing enzyme
LNYTCPMCNIVNSPGIDAELTAIIIQIVDMLSEEDMRNEIALREWRNKVQSLERMANEAELKIKIAQIRKLRKAVRDILKRSTNKLILSTIETPSN